MPDAGLLLTLPAQSVTVRLLLAAVIAVVAARVLLRAGLQVPPIRVATALLPAAALLTILVVSLGNYRLPSVMLPTPGGGSVLVPLENSYAHLAPLAVPALLVGWLLVVAGRVTWRLQRVWRCSRHVARTAAASSVPLDVRRTVQRVAARMEMESPPVALVSDCPGGATVIGLWRPTILLDADLVSRLDPHELEGVLAHELAHVSRRDNLVALCSSLLRDVLFFVPGGRWALRQLLVERELAADHVAARITRRPGALAGGLLKVLEMSGPDHACAALLPNGTLVQRVNRLLDDQPAPTRTRTATEVVAVAASIALVIAAATGIPRVVAGSDPDGGLGFLLTAPPPTQPAVEAPPAAPPRVFSTYERAPLRTVEPATETPVVIDDDPNLFSGTWLAACDANSRRCGTRPRSATMALQPATPFDAETLPVRWRAHPVVETGDLLRIYWLSSMQ